MLGMPVDWTRRRARALLELGRCAEALAFAQRALAENPNDSESLELEGLCRLRLGELASARASLRQAIAAAPNRAHAHYLYAHALKDSGPTAEVESENELRCALELDPEEPVYLRALAELCADLGRHEEALRLARQATEAAPERAANQVTLGFVASAAGDKTLARQAYEQALALDPAEAAAWNNLGCLDLEAGRLARARARFREAVRLDPAGERMRRNLERVAAAAVRARSFVELMEAVVCELRLSGAPMSLLGALLLETPAAGAALFRGGRRGAAASGAATALALLAMGPLSLWPLSAGGLLAGGAWLARRRTLARERGRVRPLVDAARKAWDNLHDDWLSGRASRSARDLAAQLLCERLTLALLEPEGT